jgi:hypothetical protein
MRDWGISSVVVKCQPIFFPLMQYKFVLRLPVLKSEIHITTPFILTSLSTAFLLLVFWHQPARLTANG